MSEKGEDNKSYGSPPEFTPANFAKWEKLFMGHMMKYVGVVKALETDEPQADKDIIKKTFQKGKETDSTRQYVIKIAKKIRRWREKNEKGYSYLLEACRNHPIALQVILAHGDRIGRSVLAKLRERFQVASTRIQQVEIARFNGLTMLQGEKAESFVNRILESKSLLESYGMVIDENVQCMGRLVDGLLKSEHYQAIGNAINVAHGMDWITAVSMIIAEDVKQMASKDLQQEVAKSSRPPER